MGIPSMPPYSRKSFKSVISDEQDTPGAEKAPGPGRGAVPPPPPVPEATLYPHRPPQGHPLERGLSAYTALPAFQLAQSMFQPFRPLAGSTVWSPELTTSTTSPVIELL